MLFIWGNFGIVWQGQYSIQQRQIMADLLLDRYEKIRTIRKTQSKSIELFVNRHSGQRVVAKIQPGAILKDSRVRNVLHQASFTQSLQGYYGIPFMVWSGKTKDERIVLLVQELGHGLKDCFQICGNKFSLKTVCMLGIQMIELIKTVHDKGFIISNVSMDVFQFGRGQKCLDLYINDLSECLNFRDPKTHVHILEPKQYYRNPENIFESTAVYENKQKSRKDDLQSLILILVYMIKGSLPWPSTFKKQSKYKKISEQFLSLFRDSKKICEGVPRAFLDILQDCRSLKFQQQPPYHWCILKLKSVMYLNRYQHDYAYDWLLTKEYQKYQTVNPRNPNMHLDKDDQYLEYLEKTVFPYIDVDEISTKYEVLWAEIEKNGEKSSLRTKINETSSNKNMESLEDNGIEREQSPGKRNENTKYPANVVHNASVLSRKKKNKQKCTIM